MFNIVKKNQYLQKKKYPQISLVSLHTFDITVSRAIALFSYLTNQKTRKKLKLSIGPQNTSPNNPNTHYY